MLSSLQHKTKALVALTFMAVSTSAFSSFEEANVPTAVKVLYCDNNSRILVQFSDPSKNVWYPANNGDPSKAFLATALAAKASGQKLYYYGLGDPAALTSYCISASARQVSIFGLE